MITCTLCEIPIVGGLFCSACARTTADGPAVNDAAKRLDNPAQHGTIRDMMNDRFTSGLGGGPGYGSNTPLTVKAIEAFAEGIASKLMTELTQLTRCEVEVEPEPSERVFTVRVRYGVRPMRALHMLEYKVTGRELWID